MDEARGARREARGAIDDDEYMRRVRAKAERGRLEVSRTASRSDIEQGMALVEKAQYLAGHFPDAEALGRARRVLEGTLTENEARAEVAAKYGFPLRQR